MAFASNSAKLTGSLLVSKCAHRSQDENSHSRAPPTKATLFLSHSEFPKAISHLFTLLHLLQQLMQPLLINISQTFIHRFYFC